MRAARRDKLQMMADILEAAMPGQVPPTILMYRANLSWVPLQRFLAGLEGQGLLQEDGSNGDGRTPRTFTTTERGHQFLKVFKQLQKLLAGSERAYNRTNVIGLISLSLLFLY